MAFIIGIIMVVVAASLVIYMVSAIAGIREALIIIALSLFATAWLIVAAHLIATGINWGQYG